MKVSFHILQFALVALCASACVTSQQRTLGTRQRTSSIHHVAPGETLYRIARMYDVSVDALMKANHIRNARKLQVGQVLKVPTAAVSMPPHARDAAISSSVGATVGRRNGTLLWPLRGVLYTHFSRAQARPHDGIDLAAPAGTPVKTSAAGKVLFAGAQRGYGSIAIIQHTKGLSTLYAHITDIQVKRGQSVRPAQVLGFVADARGTTGPHVHFEVRKSGIPVNPFNHLGPIPKAP